MQRLAAFIIIIQNIVLGNRFRLPTTARNLQFYIRFLLIGVTGPLQVGIFIARGDF
jgi:hypothetical protein